MGRPAKHLYGLNRVSRSLIVRPGPPQLRFPGTRDPTPHPGPETHDSKPTRYPFKSKTAAHGGSSFLRTCGWGGVAKLFLILFAGGLWLRVKRAGPVASPLARVSAVGSTAV